MRYRLRTLLIVLALLPPVLAVAWTVCSQSLLLRLLLQLALFFIGFPVAVCIIVILLSYAVIRAVNKNY